jgi:CheY-like chemotaxis protein/two-component sensor histidine kinase
MRTPMNAIIGMANIANKADDTEEKDHALKVIGEASSYLLNIINDVLDMAKIEADKLELDSVEYDFERMLQKVVSVINFRISEKHLVLTLNVDKQIPRFVVGDDQRLAQVITNLLSNAMKFTPEHGKIRVDAYLESETESECMLRIEVADTGIGMSPDQVERLFNAFEQVEKAVNRKYGGTGLGLVISKRIIELMGGEIWVQSEIGKGAKFIFTVMVKRGNESHDLKATSHHGEQGADVDEFKGKRLLVAEDVETNCEILVALLDGSGISIDCVENGKEALDKVAAEPDKYDIIFMDVRMPQMDGLEATRRIRDLPMHRDTRLPIIALTANVFKDDIDACIEAGMDDHLGKPFDIGKITKILRIYLT